MEFLNELHWDERVKHKLIGRGGKYYMAIRILFDRIMEIQHEMKIVDKTYRLELENIDYNVTTPKIEEYGYKGYMAILQSKLDEALFDLNKFKTISSEIPDWGGKVNCVLDYIMHGQRWLCNEIRSRTICNRMNERNCIAYIKEAERLTGYKFI